MIAYTDTSDGTTTSTGWEQSIVASSDPGTEDILVPDFDVFDPLIDDEEPQEVGWLETDRRERRKRSVKFRARARSPPVGRFF